MSVGGPSVRVRSWRQPSVRLTPAQSRALYRKYRPATFAEVIGQEHVTDPLRQALSSGRIHHAYLFSGPRGCGKTSSARILARSLNCEQGPTPDPCGVCDSCAALAPNGPGASTSSRSTRPSTAVSTTPATCANAPSSRRSPARFKVYIIDEAHMVTTAGLQRPAQARRGTAGLPDVRLRDHRAGKGHPDDPVAHPPLPVPADAASGAARAPRVDLRAEERQVRAGRAAVGGPRGRRVGARLAVDPGPVAGRVRPERGAATIARSPCWASPTRPCSTTSSTRSRPADGAAVYGTVDRVVEAGHDPRRFAADLLDRLRDLILLDAVPDAAARA